MNWFQRLFVNDQAPVVANDQVGPLGANCDVPVCGYPGFPQTGGLTNYYSGMGTGRDQSSQSFYNFPRVYGRWELENAYRSSWVAKRIVNLPPNDMTREWRKCTVGGDDDGSMVRAIEDAEKALQIKKNCNLALKWARLYGGAVMFLNLTGDNPQEPLDLNRIRRGQLESVLVLDRWNINFGNTDYIFNVGDPQFALPQFYQIQNSGQLWHNTRIIRFDGEELPLHLWEQNDRWSDSTLNHILQTLSSLEAAQHACLMAMQQGSLDIVSLPQFRDMVASDAQGMNKLHHRIRVFSDLKSIYRTAVKDVDERFERIAASLGGYDNLFERFQDEVCGAAEMPHTVLYGQSPAGLRATGDYDTRQYYDHISTLQEDRLRPQLDYLDQVLIRAAIGAMPPDYSFDFKPLWQIDETAQSQIQLRNAQRDDLYVKNGSLEPEMVARQLLKDDTYSTLTGDDVNLIASFNEPMSSAEPTMPSRPTGEPQPEMAPPGQGVTVPGTQRRNGRRTLQTESTLTTQ